MGFHLHVHVLLADGGWLPDGTFRDLLAFDSSRVEKVFRAEVLRLLVARGKISDAVVESLLSWKHSGFSVHAAVRVEDRSEAVRLGRYGIRCPLVLERLAWDEAAAEVVYRARPGRKDGRGESVARWNILEFLARVLDHLPDPSQQLLCPFCGAKMRTIAFLIDFASLRRLLGHLGFAPQQPEPLAHGPPPALSRPRLSGCELPGLAERATAA